MKKKEVLIIIAAVLIFCSGAFSMVFKSALKSAARITELVVPKASGIAKASGSEIVEDTINLSEFDDIKIDVSSLNTYIEPGDSYKLEYHVREEYVPQVDQDGHELEIKQPSHFGINIVGLFEDEDEYYRLIVPKDSGIFKVDVESSSGTVSVEDLQIKGKIKISSGNIKIKDIEGDELKLYASSGNISLENVNIEDLKLDISSGGIKAENCITDKLDAEMTSGNMNLEGIKFNKADFDMTSGNLKAVVSGKEEDYSYNLEATSGNLKVGDKRYGDKYKSGNDKDHMITVDMTSGNCNITFED